MLRRVGRVIDDFAGQPPNVGLLKKTRKKKPLLRGIITRIEDQTSLDYPDVHLYYAMILDAKDSSITRGLITNERVENKDTVRQVVYLSAFTLDYLAEKVITGVLVEEFLHYVYRMKTVIVTQTLGGRPDKEEMEPIDQWFKDRYFRECFELAQEPAAPGEAKPMIHEWSKRKYPVVDHSQIPSLSGALNFEVPREVFEALMKRGRLPEAPERQSKS